MGFLKRLFGTASEGDSDDPRPLLEWPGDDEDAVQLRRVEHFDVFLEDLREVAPEGSILVIEGKPTQDVRGFLERVRIKPEVRIARGTLWPKRDFFHVPATRENVDEILELTLNHAERRVHGTLVSSQSRQRIHDGGDRHAASRTPQGTQALSTRWAVLGSNQ